MTDYVINTPVPHGRFSTGGPRVIKLHTDPNGFLTLVIRRGLSPERVNYKEFVLIVSTSWTFSGITFDLREMTVVPYCTEDEFERGEKNRPGFERIRLDHDYDRTH